MELPIAANDNTGLFYVYLWRDALGVPFYVGKGRGRRAFETYERSQDFTCVYSAGGCAVEIVDWFIHESQSLVYEIELIAQYGRREFGGSLVNKTDGGEGSSGHVKSQETIDLWRSKNVGRKRSDDVGARISKAKMGHVVTAETRSKISEAVRKRFERPEERERMRAVALNRTDETRAKMSAGQSARFQNQSPLERARHRERSARLVHTEETRSSISRALKGIPKGQATIESMRTAQRLKPPRGQYKGVNLDRNRWVAIITIDGVRRYLGGFADPMEAAKAYDEAATDAWGAGNCYLNLPVAANDNAHASFGFGE